MQPVPELAAGQFAFANHLRDPARRPPPEGCAPERVAVYGELFFNNIDGVLGDALPQLRGQLGAGQWQQLVRRFYAEQNHREPLFHRLPGEFVTWLAGGGALLPLPLLELADFEWQRLSLSWAEAAAVPPTVAGGLRLLAPQRLLGYRYPVHRLPGSAVAESSWLLLWRNRHDRVELMELTPAGALLLSRVAANPSHRSGELLAEVATTIGHPDPAAASAFGRQLLVRWRELGVIAGEIDGGSGHEATH